jgi:hypothetical protein
LGGPQVSRHIIIERTVVTAKGYSTDHIVPVIGIGRISTIRTIWIIRCVGKRRQLIEITQFKKDIIFSITATDIGSLVSAKAPVRSSLRSSVLVAL